MHLLATTLMVSLLSLSTRADVIGWSGLTCNGAEGADVSCDNSCVAFTPPQRASIQVVAAGSHCLTLFQGTTACTGNIGQILNPGGGACTTVATGITVGSFKCSPNSVCSSIATSVAPGNVTALASGEPAAKTGSV